METIFGKEGEKCKRCGAINTKVIIPQSGELVCENCGLVYAERIIDETYEKRNFSSENSGGKKIDSRISGPSKLSGSSLGSNLVTSVRGGGQKLITNRGTPEISTTERGLAEITSILSNIGVNESLIKEAKDIFEAVSKTKNMKGRNIKNLVGAIYFIASRRKGCALTFKQIAQMMYVKEKDIIKAYKFIKNVVVDNSSHEQLNEVIKTYIRRFAESNISKVTNEVKQLAWKIAENIIMSCMLEGRNTKTIAGISLMIANNLLQEKLTKAEIAKDFTGEATLDKVFQKIKDRLTYIVPEKYHDRISTLLSKK